MLDKVEAADCPDDGLGRGGGRPFDMPKTGSAFDDGHGLFGGFFFAGQGPCSPLIADSSPLDCDGGTGIVNVDEEDEEDDAIEDEEFVLCVVLRGMKILVTSSAFIECRPPCPVSVGFH